MTIDEFEPEDVLLEISRKLSNVSIHKLPAHGGTVEKDAVSVGQYGFFRTFKIRFDLLIYIPFSCPPSSICSFRQSVIRSSKVFDYYADT